MLLASSPSSQAAIAERRTATLLRLRCSATARKAIASSQAWPKAQVLTAAPIKEASAFKFRIVGCSRCSPCSHREAVPQAHSADVTAARRAFSVIFSSNLPSWHSRVNATCQRTARAQAAMAVPMLMASGLIRTLRRHTGAPSKRRFNTACHFLPRARELSKVLKDIKLGEDPPCIRSKILIAVCQRAERSRALRVIL